MDPRTNLVEAALVREDGNVSVEARASCPSNRLAECSYCCEDQESAVPDMVAAVAACFEVQVAKCRDTQDDRNIESLIGI